MNRTAHNFISVIILLFVCLVAFISCSADEKTVVNTKNVAWQKKGFVWGAETNDIKAGLLISSSVNGEMGQTLVQITPVTCNGSISNDSVQYPRGGALFWLPPLASRYQMELYSSNGIPVPKTTKGKMFGKALNLRPKIRRFSTGAGGPFVEPGYLYHLMRLNDTNQIASYDFHLHANVTDAFVIQDLFKITAPGNYRLEFEMRALKPKGDIISINLQPFYLPVSVELEIKP